MFVYPNLRDANAARAIEWSNGGDGPQFYAVELYGESGEALNVVKKLEREKLGMVGSRATLQDMADEIADVIICVDLLAIAYDLPPIRSIPIGTVRSSLWEAIAMGRATGSCMADVEALEMERDFYGELRSVSALYDDLCNVQIFAECLARSYDIDPDAAISKKFNTTSTKYGLKTMMQEVT
jgi:hypothetical protein